MKIQSRLGVTISKPYLIYTAILTQVLTDAPIVTVLENTLSGVIVWTRTSTGIYLGTLAAAFPLGKTWAIAQYNGSGGDAKVGLKLFRLSNDTVQLVSYDSSEIPYELHSEIEEYIEIRVYP